jgi:hypothetical protein
VRYHRAVLVRSFHVLVAAAVTAVAGGPQGCQCQCGGGSGALTSPAVHNVSSSPECDAVCKKIEGCGAQCDRDAQCKIDRGKCVASKKALLRCQAEKSVFTCLPPSGFSTASTCVEDEALCTGADPETTKVPTTP